MDLPGGTLNLDPSGFIGGVTVGYNLQTGSWVWGLEGDFDYSAAKASFGATDFKDRWFATARGRIGYAGWTNFMPYITGGAAFADLKATNPLGTSTDWRIGWTVGAGVEYALFSNWSVKGEYLYADLGKLGGGTTGAADISYKTNIVRAGVNYRF